MVIVVLKCQMCGKTFEAEVLDDDDPQERDRPGNPIRCPQCNSPRVETTRRIRRSRPAKPR
jgi:DNA-directed RNA polymerase subunit RPC12/RpoP